MEENMFKPFIDDEEFFWNFVRDNIYTSSSSELSSSWGKLTNRARIVALKTATKKLIVENQKEMLTVIDNILNSKVHFDVKQHYLLLRLDVCDMIYKCEQFLKALNQIQRDKYNPVGENIKELIEAKGISMRQLSKMSNVAFVTVSQIVSGKQKAQYKTIIKIANALNVSVAELKGE